MKKILIFTAGFGEGHNSAARNIRDGLELVGGSDVQVDIIDLFDECYGRFNDMVRSAYLQAINNAPKVWQGIYNFLDHSRAMETNLIALSRMRRALEDLLRETQPDLVCSTYPVYNFLLDEIYSDGRPRSFSQITMVTDSISINSLWYRASSDVYLVPNEETAKIFHNAGVPDEKVLSLGFPVPLAFALPESRKSIADPGPDEPPRVLYMINSGKKRAPKIIEGLLENKKLRLTITAGRDVKLQQILAEQTRKDSDRVEILGWTSKVPELLMTHHLLVGKAGGATVQEAIAAECPMIVNQVVPGQEEGNWELLRRNDCGVLAEKADDVAEWAARAFADEAALWKTWRKNLRGISVPDSSLRIARFLLDRCAPVNVPLSRNGRMGSADPSHRNGNGAGNETHLRAVATGSSAPAGKKLLLCDLHTHTTYSDGKLSLRDLVDFYGQREFDVLGITDHIVDDAKVFGKVCRLSGLVLPNNQVDEYFEMIGKEKKRALDRYGMILFAGLEFNKDGVTAKTSTHLLGVDLKAPIDPSLGLEELIAAIHAQGGLAIAAHPHVNKSVWGKNTLYLWENQEKFAPLIDAWEIGNRDDLYNPVGLKRLPFIANSDFHKPKHIHSWKTMLFCEKDPEAIKTCIRINRDVALTLYRDHLFGQARNLPVLGEGKAEQVMVGEFAPIAA